jgi:hypothetical protein
VRPEPLLGTLPPELAKEVARIDVVGAGEVRYRERFLTRW